MTIDTTFPGGGEPYEGGCVHWINFRNEDVEAAHAEGRLAEYMEQQIEGLKKSVGFSLSMDGEPVGFALGWIKESEVNPDVLARLRGVKV
jgi:hypothetical protein